MNKKVNIFDIRSRKFRDSVLQEDQQKDDEIIVEIDDNPKLTDEIRKDIIIIFEALYSEMVGATENQKKVEAHRKICEALSKLN